MVPLPRDSSIGGIPLPEFLATDRIEAIVKRTRSGGAEIVELLKTGSAYYAPAAATFEVVESILLDRRRLIPCAALLEGEYGVKGLYVGVPVVIGGNGIEKIIEITLTSDEAAAFKRSADAVKELVDLL
jgi:malate dehydrogenase